MLDRRQVLGSALTGFLATGAVRRGWAAEAPAPESRSESRSAGDRLNRPGAEARMLAGRTGRWAVRETAWATPGAAPVVSTGSVAERVMLGALLQEILRPQPGTGQAGTQRTDLLTFDRLDGRWDYVSFDARGPDGIMTAWSRDAGTGTEIAFDFAPFATPQAGTAPVGLFLRMDQVIRFIDADHDVKEQFFTLADGSGRRWLGHRYEYTRIAARG